jgi:hypothetical protein
VQQLQAELAHKTKAIKELMDVGVMDSGLGGESVAELKGSVKRLSIEREELALKVKLCAMFVQRRVAALFARDPVVVVPRVSGVGVPSPPPRWKSATSSWAT